MTAPTGGARDAEPPGGRPAVVRFGDDAVTLSLLIDPAGPVRTLGLTPAGDPLPAAPADPGPLPLLVELGLVGDGPADGSTSRHRLRATGTRLRYVRHAEDERDGVRALAVVQADPATELVVTTTFRLYPGTGTLRVASEVGNGGREHRTLADVSSLSLGGFAGPGGRRDGGGLFLWHADNAWAAEARWHRLTAEQAGLVDIAGFRIASGSTRTRFALTAVGSWSSADHLPTGAIERAGGPTWAWQVEHNAAWHAEVGDAEADLHLLLAGPTEQEHGWRHALPAGGSFRTVPAAVTVSPDGFAGAVGRLTAYRRAIRRPSRDVDELPVVFNDYMNCLFGAADEATLPPLIDAAARAGAEIFVLDAGWYSDDSTWWSSVGAWEPSAVRYPAGLPATLARIRAAGMVPGLWVEPEAVGVDSPVADTLPEQAFFCRDGRRVVAHGRYKLDFRHPAVVEWMDGVADRLVGYGAGYFKFDDNINIGIGTDVAAAGPGAGLLAHTRAFLGWVDRLLDRHPGLVVENCSSGGMRMDYAQLARMSLQSTSDQTDPVRYAAIAAAAPSAVAPEQAANWAYPQPAWDAETNALTCVNAMVGRFYLSGRIDLLDDAAFAAVAEAVTVHRSLRPLLRRARPAWPLGLPGWYDPWVALALRDDGPEPGATGDTLLAVWRRDSAAPSTADLRLPWLAGRRSRPTVVYPTGRPGEVTAGAVPGELRITIPVAPAARLVRLSTT